MSLTAGKLHESHEYGMCGEFTPPTTQNSLIGAVDGTHDSILSTTPACPYKVTINTNQIITKPSSGNGYTLNGTLGQPDAGTLSSGGGYTLTGGFWHSGVLAPSETKVYLPLLVK